MPPFGAAAGMPPFGGAAAGSPFGAAPGAGGFRSPAVDVPSSTVSGQDDSKKGEKFKANASATAPSSEAAKTSGGPNLDVVVRM